MKGLGTMKQCINFKSTAWRLPQIADSWGSREEPAQTGKETSKF